MILIDTLASMQRAALVLLVVYCAVAIILLPRELTFLAGIEQPFRRCFIVLDVLIQLSILAVLIPCAIGEPAMALGGAGHGHLPWGWAAVTFGFIGMWVTVIWSITSRYKYISRLLAKVREESEQALRELQQDLNAEDRRHG